MIKNSLLTLGLIAVLASCNNQAKNGESSNTDSTEVVGTSNDSTATAGGKIEFENNVYEFGTIKEGDKVDHVFKFKNTGTEPVILAQVSASCGCTTPEYTKDPILPGKEGEIKVSYNSEGQVGLQQKIVTISSNAETPVQTVQLKGTVEK